MGIKDNFSQAVKELWKKDGQEQNGDQPSAQPSELDQYLRQQESAEPSPSINDIKAQEAEIPLETPYFANQTPEAAQTANPNPQQNVQQNNVPNGGLQNNQNAQSVQQNQNPEQNNVNMNVQSIRNNFGQNNQNDMQDNGGYNNFGGNYNRGYNNGFGGNGGYNPPPASGVAPAQPQSESNELTVISKNTVIDGNVRSLANMQIDGNIKGNVETTKNVDMTGKVVGDVTCNNAAMTSAAMQGNVSLKGRMKMDRDTILIGDLSSQYADINGRIRGKLDIVGKAELKRDAIVFGDINASTIAVTDGAIIQGYVNTTFLSKEDSRNVFPDAISFDKDNRNNQNPQGNENPNT